MVENTSRTRPSWRSWDDRLLFAPLSTLSPTSRRLVVALAVVLTFAWSVLRNGNLDLAWSLPDVKSYLNMAVGRFDLVPAPFSSRPLAPLLARAIAAPGHWQAITGFAVLAYASLLVTLAVVFGLLAHSGAPRWTLLLVAAVPFWPQLLGNAGLPDPLYAALVALFLLALQQERLIVAALLLFPLMFARESTSLTLLCLVAVGFRRLRWPGSLLAVAATAAGALAVGHLSQGSLPNPERLPGLLYLSGKLPANFLRSLGITPWSNVYPDLCATPVWQHAFAFGRVQSIGVCHYSPVWPLQALAALFTVFGALPLALCVLWRAKRSLPADLLTRFCLLYGTVSFLLAPALGTWYIRLFAYGWPLFLVALPRLLHGGVIGEDRIPLRNPHTVWGGLLVCQLLVCALGQTQITPLRLTGIVVLQASWAALFLVHRRVFAEARVQA